MRTRCPVCGTVFRATSEQVRLKAGKVRCGHCQGLFNAFDNLLPDEPPAPLPATTIAPVARERDWPETPVDASPEPVSQQPSAEPPLAMPPEPDCPVLPAIPPEEITASTEITTVSEPVLDDAREPTLAEDRAEIALPDDDPPAPEETNEQATQAAREAGLLAARELSETAAYNRWAVGTLASDGGGVFSSEAQRPAWPFTLVALLLAFLLATQAAYHFRGELVRSLPASQSLFAAFKTDIPLARNAELVAIEASDLQSDAARGLFVLQATLKNRAAYRQAWPSLELTLTDVRDAVVTRRVLAPADYLPPGTDPEAFAADGEVSVRLWLEARGIGAAGYRLYIFYP